MAEGDNDDYSSAGIDWPHNRPNEPADAPHPVDGAFDPLHDVLYKPNVSRINVRKDNIMNPIPRQQIEVSPGYLYFGGTLALSVGVAYICSNLHAPYEFTSQVSGAVLTLFNTHTRWGPAFPDYNAYPRTNNQSIFEGILNALIPLTPESLLYLSSQQVHSLPVDVLFNFIGGGIAGYFTRMHLNRLFHFIRTSKVVHKEKRKISKRKE